MACVTKARNCADTDAVVPVVVHTSDENECELASVESGKRSIDRLLCRDARSHPPSSQYARHSGTPHFWGKSAEPTVLHK